MTEARTVEFEVLPPPSKEDNLSRWLAWILDDLIPIPGTKYRLGLDPIIGLIPGLGDTSASTVSLLILMQAFRAGVPRIVLVRMAMNLVINGLVGAIPGVGDFFSAVFKSNRRNYELLSLHSGSAKVSTTADWAFLIGLFAVLLVFFVGMAIVSGYLVYRLFAFLF